MKAKSGFSLRQTIADEVNRLVDDLYDGVEKALADTNGQCPSSITVRVAFKPSEDAGELELEITGKSTNPGRSALAKVRIANGKQLELL